MSKKETSLRASERLKFDETKFVAGDTVVYRNKDTGTWEVGKLMSALTRGKTAGKDVIKARIGGADIDLNVAPKKVLYPTAGEGFVINNVPYLTVGNPKAGPKGEILYDLRNTVTGEIMHNVPQEALENIMEVVKLTFDAETQLNDLKFKAGEIRDAKRVELLQRLIKLEDKSQQISELTGRSGKFDSSREATEYEELSKQIKDLRTEIEEEVRKSTAEIESIKITEAATGENLAKIEAAKDVEDKFNIRADSVDGPKKIAFENKLAEYKTKKARFEEWVEEEKTVREPLEAMRKAYCEQKIKDAKAADPKAKPPKDLPKEVPTPPGAKPDWVTSGALWDKYVLLHQPSTTPGGKKPEKYGVEPNKENYLESVKPDVRRTLYLNIYIELNAKLTSALSKSEAQLVKEVDKRLKENALKLSYASGLYPYQEKIAAGTTPTAKDENEFKMIVAGMLEKIIEEWKALTPEPEPFNFDEQKKGLEAKWEELNKKVIDGGLQNEPCKGPGSALTLGKELGEIYGKPGVLSINGLDKNDPNASREIIDLWRWIGDLEVQVFSAERKKQPAEEKETAVTYVDIPKELFGEMLNSNPAQAEATFRKAFDLIIEGAGDAHSLQAELVKFVDTLDVAPFRDSLVACGIFNWEAFKKQFKGEVARKFSNVILELANSELSTRRAQSITDIKREKLSGREIEEVIADWWKYSFMSHMSKPAALRFGTYTLTLGMVGVSLSAVTKGLDFAFPFWGKEIRAGLVGGTVGALKVLLQKIMGKSHIFEAEQAKKQAADQRSELVKEEWLKSKFDYSAPGAVSGVKAGQKNSLGRIFSSALRSATVEKGQEKLKIKIGPNKEIELEGEEVCEYYAMLERAALDLGENVGDKKEEEERTRLEFFKALHAMRHNKKIQVTEMPPAAVRWLQKGFAALSGRKAATDKALTEKREIELRALRKGEKLPEAPAPAAKEKAKKEGEGEQPKKEWDLKQYLTTAALGASLGEAALRRSANVRAALGGLASGLAGMSSSYEKSKNKADLQSEKNLEGTLTLVDNLLKKILGGGASNDELRQLRDWSEMLEKLPNGLDLTNIPLKFLSKNELAFYRAHTRDVASFLQRNSEMNRAVNDMLHRIKESGALLKLGFSDTITYLKSAGDRGEAAAEAKNSFLINRWRQLKRYVKGGVYGYLGAEAAIAFGKGIDAIKPVVTGTADSMAHWAGGKLHIDQGMAWMHKHNPLESTAIASEQHNAVTSSDLPKTTIIIHVNAEQAAAAGLEPAPSGAGGAHEHLTPAGGHHHAGGAHHGGGGAPETALAGATGTEAAATEATTAAGGTGAGSTVETAGGIGPHKVGLQAGRLEIRGTGGHTRMGGSGGGGPRADGTFAGAEHAGVEPTILGHEAGAYKAYEAWTKSLPEDLIKYKIALEQTDSGAYDEFVKKFANSHSDAEIQGIASNKSVSEDFVNRLRGTLKDAAVASTQHSVVEDATRPQGAPRVARGGAAHDVEPRTGRTGAARVETAVAASAPEVVSAANPLHMEIGTDGKAEVHVFDDSIGAKTTDFKFTLDAKYNAHQLAQGTDEAIIQLNGKNLTGKFTLMIGDSGEKVPVFIPVGSETKYQFSGGDLIEQKLAKGK